jgi:hypothetical protein
MPKISQRTVMAALCFFLTFSRAYCDQEPSAVSPGREGKQTAGDATTAELAEENARHSVPDESEYRKVLVKLEMLFAKDFENARTKPRYKKPFAEKLMELTPDTQNASERFVMLSESLRMLEADAPEMPSSIPLLISCADSIGAEFHVSACRLKADSLAKISVDVKTTLASIKQIFKHIVPLVQEAINRDDYAAAKSLADTGELIAQRLVDSKFRAEIKTIAKDVEALELQYTAFKQAESSLQADPGNKKAHRVAGLYLGLRKGLWLEAERHIKRIDDAEVQSLFVRTLTEARTAEDSARLADDWWNWSAREMTIESRQAKVFASHLYSTSADKLEGLSKIVAKERTSSNESLSLLVGLNNTVVEPAKPPTVADEAQSPGSESKLAGWQLAPGETRQDDEIGKRLGKAKEKYVAAMEATRKPIIVQIDRLEARSRQSDSPAKVQSVVQDRERFEKFGVVPGFCDVSLIRQRASAHEKIVEAFRFAIRDYNKNKQDADAAAARMEMNTVWPEFLDQPVVGGWNPMGDARIEINSGLVAITGNGPTSGIVSTNEFPPNKVLTVNLCGSENVKATIGIRVHLGKNRRLGYTSAISGDGEKVTVGKIGVEGQPGEVGVRYSHRKPNEFFELRFGFDQFEAATVTVDGQHSVGMGPIDQTPAKIGIFVTGGTLVVKSIEITDPR